MVVLAPVDGSTLNSMTGSTVLAHATAAWVTVVHVMALVVMPSAVASMAGLPWWWRWAKSGAGAGGQPLPDLGWWGDRGAVGRRAVTQPPWCRLSSTGCRSRTYVAGRSRPLDRRDTGEVCRAVCGGGPRFRGAGLVTF